MRQATISDLETQVEKFAQKAKENGFIIHRAADAAEARGIVLEIAKSRGAKLISKSKSMMSEEIDLNPAMEAADIEVVETDLGEYIVQLPRGAPIAHHHARGSPTERGCWGDLPSETGDPIHGRH